MAAALGSWRIGLGLVLVALFVAAPLARLGQSGVAKALGGAEARARRHLDRFVAAHPAWSVRLYRTPAGLRLLATHRPCEAGEEEVATFFRAVAADPVYVRMCKNQHCFRARLTAKPWRIGVATHMRPRPGVWPVSAQGLAARTAWVAAYEARAAGFAACRYLGSVGSGVIHERLRPVVELHDRESRALEAQAPLA